MYISSGQSKNPLATGLSRGSRQSRNNSETPGNVPRLLDLHARSLTLDTPIELLSTFELGDAITSTRQAHCKPS